MSSTKVANVLVLSWEYAPLMAGGLGPLIQAAVSELRNQNIKTTVVIPHNLKDSGIEDEDIVSLNQEMNKLMRTDCNLPDYKYNNFNQFQSEKREESNNWPDLYSNKRKKLPKRNLYPNTMPKQTRAFALAVMEFLKKSKVEYDVIIGPDWHVIAFFHLLKSNPETKHIPFYFYVNATQFDRSIILKGPTAQTCDKMECEFYPLGDMVIAISDISKQILIDHHKVEEERIVTVYDDYDFVPSTLSIPLLENKYNKNVLFLGRLDAQKGIPILLDTASRVVDIDHEITFIIAGQGASMENTIDLICEYGLEKNVFLTGWIGGEDKSRLYKTANLFVMPSPSEPFGLTALEAIRSDVPVISSKTCGFLSVVPSTPVFDYHDTYDFAQKIVYYLQHPDAAAELLNKQQADLSKHSWSDQIAKLKEKIITHKSK